MKKVDNGKSSLTSYAMNWISVILTGLLTFGSWYLYHKSYIVDANNNIINNAWCLGLSLGLFGMLCFLTLYAQLTPVARWIWLKIKRNPKPFSELIRTDC